MSRINPRGATVVITGAGSGIGATTAIRFAKLGARVIVADIDEAAAKETAEACRQYADHAYPYMCDVADADAVTDLARAVSTEVGDVDVLVNNAGVVVAGPFLDTTDDDWTWLRSVNLDGVMHGCRAFGSQMVARGRGHIVNVASGAAYLPNRRMTTYCTSKAAVVMMSRCLRADWSRHNVGVSVVCPSAINTPILEHMRLRGDMVDEKARLAKIFSVSHSPEVVAKAITGAVAHNRAMVSAGIEMKISYHALRLVPPLSALLARV